MNFRYAGAQRPEKPDHVLVHYTIPEFVKEDYRKLNRRSPNSGLVDAITAHVAQARGYFAAADAADNYVRPVMVYYGIVGLSRAFALIRGSCSSEAGIAPAHGLEPRNWSSSLSKGDLTSLELRTTKKGTFPELGKAITPIDYVWIYTAPFPARIRAPIRVAPLDAGVTFSLEDLLSRTPTIQPFYVRARKARQEVGTTEIVAFWLNNGQLDLLAPAFGEIPPVRDQNAHASRFWRDFGISNLQDVSHGTNHQFLAEGSYWSCRLKGSLDVVIPAAGKLENDADMGIHLTKPLPSGHHIHALQRLFAIAFILSMLARYHAPTWQELLMRGKASRFYPLIEQMAIWLPHEFTRLWVRAVESWRNDYR